MKTAEIDAFARHGGQFAGMQGRRGQAERRQTTDDVVIVRLAWD